MPIFKIYHVTRYEYDRQVKESLNEIKIYPYHCTSQEVLQHEITITGQPNVLTYIDYWGNKSGSFNLLPPHQELLIESKLIIRTLLPESLEVNFLSRFEELRKEVDGQLQLLELASPDMISQQAEIDKMVASIYQPQKSVAATIGDCCTYIFQTFTYLKGITNIETTVDQLLQQKAGVCQDFAHVMLQVLRTLAIPSRYVSGYICPNKNGMRGEGATHAWVEAWVPQFGWAGIDPTNNIWVTNNHVKLAVGRHFNDCSPVKGSFKGPANQKLSVMVSVGYEDGQLFEEVNNVPMPESESLPPLPLPVGMSMQQ